MPQIDVSIILNIHREALYLRPTLLSLEACARDARAAGISAELIAVFDRSDPETLSVFNDTSLEGFHQIKTAEIDVGSLGLARNAGIELAEGEFVWTADGDDLVSRNSIVQLVKTADNHRDENVFIFLEYLVAFGERFHVVRYFDSNWLTPADFAYQHPYVSRVFGKTKDFRNHQYRDLKVTSGFAYEDWDFNNRLIAAGYRLQIAPNTVLFYRQRRASLLQQANAVSSRLPPHSDLFEPGIFRKMMIECRTSTANWPALMKSRQDLHSRSFSTEFLESSERRQFVLDAARLDPDVEPRKIETAPTYCSVPWNSYHWGFQLERFYELIGNSVFSDVVILPWLKPGGAEKYLLQVLEELRDQGLCKNILVLAGQSASKHEWLSKLPKGAVFVDVYNTFPRLSDEERMALLTRAILAVTVKGGRIHLKASELAHNLMTCFGSAFSFDFRPIYYRFCDDIYYWQGEKLDDASGVRHLREQSRNLHALVSDCAHIINQDKARLGALSSRHHLLYARCEVLANNKKHQDKPNRRLLWASRISKQKRPELLPQLARYFRAHNFDVDIDVYGPIDNPYNESLFSVPGLRYCGYYQSFCELKIESYDALIYTTAFDGLPNIILEAMGTDLPVIAPNIGGIGEVVKSGLTGYLIEDHADEEVLVKRYAQAIEGLYSNWDLVGDLSRNARKLIIDRHGQESYAAAVRRIYGDIYKES